MAIQESGEMYLETILVLSKKSSNVRAIDVGEYMGYSKPSVSRALKILKNGDYIEVGEDGGIILTDLGRSVAEKIYERHNVLSKGLMMLGIDEKTAVDDACRIEHVISDLSFEKIKEHLKKFEK